MRWGFFSGLALLVLGQARVDAVDYANDIAPILNRNCVECHRPEGVAPFSLQGFAAARKRARQIEEVTQSGFMPPWLPETGYGPDLHGRRGLDAKEIDALARWYELDCPPGDLHAVAEPPPFPSGWRLGEPDRVVSMEEPYAVPAEGEDIVRNFVIRLPVNDRKYVRAVEFQCDNSTVVHHAFLQLDSTSSSRRRDEADTEPGFDGMDLSDGVNPDGHFLGWAPGADPYEVYPGTQWTLNPGTDLVLQLHLLPSGKATRVQPRIGLYFTEEPPTREPFVLLMKSKRIDIPAGERNYQVERSFVTPVGLKLLRVFPHAHYLGRRFELFATSSEGDVYPLLKIQDWDFNWQTDYRFETPVSLPAGAKITMRWEFDNSDLNHRNPNVPAKRVRYGPGSFDEMAEVSLQILLDDEAERSKLGGAYARFQIEEDPTSFFAYNNLGLYHVGLGHFEEAEENYRAALRINPAYEVALNNLAVALSKQDQLEEALALFRKALEVKPDYLDARINIANMLFKLGRFRESSGMASAILDQGFGSAELELLHVESLIKAGSYPQAMAALGAYLAREPKSGALNALAGECALMLDRVEEAERYLHRAIQADKDAPQPQYLLSLCYLQAGRSMDAKRTLEALLAIHDRHALGFMRLGQIESREGSRRKATVAFANAWNYSTPEERELIAKALKHPLDLEALGLGLRSLDQIELADAVFRLALQAAEQRGDAVLVERLRHTLSSL